MSTKNIQARWIVDDSQPKQLAVIEDTEDGIGIRDGVMIRSSLLIWWFAVVTGGQAVFMEYRTEHACQIIQRAYERSGVQTTICQWRG